MCMQCNVSRRTLKRQPLPAKTRSGLGINYAVEGRQSEHVLSLGVRRRYNISFFKLGTRPVVHVAAMLPADVCDRIESDQWRRHQDQSFQQIH